MHRQISIACFLQVLHVAVENTKELSSCRSAIHTLDGAAEKKIRFLDTETPVYLVNKFQRYISNSDFKINTT